MDAAPHIIAINGILTRATQDSWPKHAIPWLEARFRCTGDAHYYRTGAIPFWNLWVTNPHVARVLASSLASRLAEIESSVHIVAHSNGCNIAVELMRQLRKRGIAVDTAVLIGAAIHSDVRRGGLGDLIAEGWLRRAVAYCSPDDAVIRPLQAVPGGYGGLGARGFEREGSATGLRVLRYQALGQEWGEDKYRYVTRMFPAYGHSDYFIAEHAGETWACLAGDMGLQVRARGC